MQKPRSFQLPVIDGIGLTPQFQLPNAPLDLEIGCGVGLHPIQYATAHPERHLIAIEKTRAKFLKFRGRLLNHPTLPNLFPVHGHAVSWVTHTLPDDCLSRVFLLYPNPLPKTSDRHKRWYRQPFMGLLRNKMKKNSTLTLVSNMDWYVSDAIDSLTSLYGFSILQQKTVTSLDESPGRTHFERKYLRDGQTCHEVHFSR